MEQSLREYVELFERFAAKPRHYEAILYLCYATVCDDIMIWYDLLYYTILYCTKLYYAVLYCNVNEAVKELRGAEKWQDELLVNRLVVSKARELAACRRFLFQR